jgi:hypothetical protein
MQKASNHTLAVSAFITAEEETIYVYRLDPIDFWPGWFTESEYMACLSSHYSSEIEVEEMFMEYNILLEQGREVARKMGWQGDTPAGPFIAGLPTASFGDDGHIMIAWKQEQSGETYIVSPYRLIWLESDRDKMQAHV